MVFTGIVVFRQADHIYGIAICPVGHFQGGLCYLFLLAPNCFLAAIQAPMVTPMLCGL